MFWGEKIEQNIKIQTLKGYTLFLRRYCKIIIITNFVCLTIYFYYLFVIVYTISVPNSGYHCIFFIFLLWCNNRLYKCSLQYYLTKSVIIHTQTTTHSTEPITNPSEPSHQTCTRDTGSWIATMSVLNTTLPVRHDTGRH